MTDWTADMGRQANEPQTQKGKLRGIHVLIGMLTFFGIIIAVNGTFIFFALDSWTGLSVENSFKRGTSYNRELERIEAQKALGWSVASSVERQGEAGSAVITVHIRDKNDDPVRGLALDVVLRHQVKDKYDVSVPVTEQKPGIYTGFARVEGGVNWELRVVTESTDGTRVRVDQDILLK